MLSGQPYTVKGDAKQGRQTEVIGELGIRGTRMVTAVIVLVALGLDALIGWPKWLYRMIGHPVTWIGALIGRLDRWLNLEDTGDKERRLAGIVAALTVIGLSVEFGVADQLAVA